MSEVTKLLLCAVTFLTVFAILRWCSRSWGAGKTLAKNKALYSGKMEYVEVSPSDFPWVDASFYGGVSASMTDAGFRFVGDFESLRASRQYPHMRTFLRWFIGDADATMAACYHVKIRGLMRAFALFRLIPKHMRIVDFESEFTDHTFLVTNNAGGLNVFTDCPEITMNQLAVGTSLDRLLVEHRQGIERIVAHHGVEPIRMRTKKDMQASQDRMHSLKSAQRKRAGYVTREQFEEMAGGELSGSQQKFVREFEKAREEDHTDQ